MTWSEPQTGLYSGVIGHVLIQFLISDAKVLLPSFSDDGGVNVVVLGVTVTGMNPQAAQGPSHKTSTSVKEI